MKFLKYLLSFVFVKQLLLAAVITIFIINVVVLWLRIYTRHNKSIKTPDFYGLTVSESDSLAQNSDIRFQVVDSIYLNDAPRGTIISQTPRPGFRVKKNRNIFLTLNAVQPERVKMPNVVGLSLRHARARLETAGLLVGKLRYKPSLAVNNVLEQKSEGKIISPGDAIIKGSKVQLVLGNGYSNKRASVPNLTGKRKYEVRNILLNDFLNQGAIVYDNSVKTHKDSSAAFVYMQRPGTNTSIRQGASVDIWLTVDSLKLKKEIK